MASKRAILFLLLVSSLYGSQVLAEEEAALENLEAKAVEAEDNGEVAVEEKKRDCPGSSPFSITIGAPPILAALLPGMRRGGGGGGGGGGGLIGSLLRGPLGLIKGLIPGLGGMGGGGGGGGGPLMKLLKLLLKPLKFLLLLPLLPLLLPLLLLLLPLLLLLSALPLSLLGPLNPLSWLLGRGWILRNTIFDFIYRLIWGWHKPGYFDGLSFGNRVPMRNQFGQRWGLYPLLGFPLAWHNYNQFGAPTLLYHQI